MNSVKFRGAQASCNRSAPSACAACSRSRAPHHAGFDAALDAGIELIHTRHEAAAVHMADAWARLTGEPGIALVTGGPGHANAVAALYTAGMAESPVVLLSGHAPLGEVARELSRKCARPTSRRRSPRRRGPTRARHDRRRCRTRHRHRARRAARAGASQPAERLPRGRGGRRSFSRRARDARRARARRAFVRGKIAPREASPDPHRAP